MKTLSIDIETYSDVPLQKTGVYRYVESPDFEILLFAYSIDSQPVQVIDLACGEQIPKEILLAIEDECVIKWAFNATFERICLSRFLGYPTGKYLKPESWRYSMIWSATMDFHSPWKVSRIKKRFDVREIKSSKDTSRSHSSCICWSWTQTTGWRLHPYLVWADMVTGIISADQRPTLETGPSLRNRGDRAYHHKKKV